MGFFYTTKQGKITDDLKDGKNNTVSSSVDNLELKRLKSASYFLIADQQNSNTKQVSPFQHGNSLVSVARSFKVPNHFPSTGEKILAKYNNTEIYLKTAQMTDHISVTYATNYSNYFAKIYSIDALQLDMLEKKAKRMLQKDIEIPGVCWPIDMLIDNNGCFIGILIPSSYGVQLTRSVFNGATGLSQFFSQWNKNDLCVLTITILKKIRAIHELGIFLGFINPASIYIVDAENVFFVDTDCWQLEGYPALSHNQTFTPPEHLRNNTPQLLCSMDEENYQIAVLTFMLMMPGKFPYAKKENSSEKNSIIDMSFPFSVGGGMRRSKDAEQPSGIWRIAWDHLSYNLCNAFYNTFHSSGKFAQPGNRLEIDDWLKMVREYVALLSDPNRIESRKNFPTTFRHDGKRIFVRCSICGQEHPSFYFLHSIRVQQEKIDIWERGYKICLPCATDQSNVSFRCDCCGRQFFYTNRAKVLHEIGKNDFDFKNQRWCKNCKKRTLRCTRCGREVPIYQMREFEDRLRNYKTNVCYACFKEMIEKAKQDKEKWKNTVAQWVTCRSCGTCFSITNGEIDYFQKKGYNLPTRCTKCRKKKY